MRVIPGERNEEIIKESLKTLRSITKQVYYYDKGKITRESRRKRVKGMTFQGWYITKMRDRFLGHAEWFLLCAIAFSNGAKQVYSHERYDPQKYLDYLWTYQNNVSVMDTIYEDALLQDETFGTEIFPEIDHWYANLEAEAEERDRESREVGENE